MFADILFAVTALALVVGFVLVVRLAVRRRCPFCKGQSVDCTRLSTQRVWRCRECLHVWTEEEN